MLYQIFAPKLYARASIGNMSSLLTGFEDDKMLINKIQHLHLYSGIHPEEPTYVDFFIRDLWSALGKDQRRATTFAAFKEVEQCALAGIEIRHAIAKGLVPFPKLRTVSLGGYENRTWASPRAKEMEQEMIDTYKLDNAKGIPQILLGLPSVEHLCQSVELGPLALSAVIYKPLTPLKVFTYHVRYPPHACVCAQEVAPIIVGAINRYYFVNAFTVNDDDVKVWSRWPAERQLLIGALIQAFELRRSVVLTPNMEESERVGLNSVPLDDTVIELYDYIRFVERTVDDQDPFTVKRGYTHRACRPAQPLLDMQRALDNALPQRWKGKVLLKDREEAPPCTACGLDLMEEWKYKIKTSMRKANGRSAMCLACKIYAEGGLY
jgi:hypothetical protein